MGHQLDIYGKVDRKRTKKDIRNAKIREEYKKLYAEKGLRHRVICDRLGDKYYLESDTIEQIVARTGTYKNS